MVLQVTAEAARQLTAAELAGRLLFTCCSITDRNRNQELLRCNGWCLLTMADRWRRTGDCREVLHFNSVEWFWLGKS